MKSSNWEECVNANSSVKISLDKFKARSLLDTANGRNKYLEEQEIKESNANYIFEAYYTSALEIMHALLLLNEYKVTNHICLGYYLRDVVNREDLFRLFDDCRFKRNSLIYYGRKMEFSVAKDAVKKSKLLIKELTSLVKIEE
ncbi:hypothetical protein HOC32_00590 [Candidatus Woesearchaeota archaeon]|jgi:hypothetical protein|nr:hypothetical protein [Candidatus Woesearchaeota archaeon]